MKNVKVSLTVAAFIICIAAVSYFAVTYNSGPGLPLDVNGYRGNVNALQEKNAGQDSAGLKQDFVSITGSRDFSDLEKDLINDKHRQIILKYKSRFARLQSEYQGKLDNLLQNAKAELERVDSNTSLVKLAYSYYKRGKALENECDARFYSMLDEMKQELHRENLPLDVVQEAEKEYKLQKKERREHLISLTREYLKGKNLDWSG